MRGALAPISCPMAANSSAASSSTSFNSGTAPAAAGTSAPEHPLVVCQLQWLCNIVWPASGGRAALLRRALAQRMLLRYRGAAAGGGAAEVMKDSDVAFMIAAAASQVVSSEWRRVKEQQQHAADLWAYTTLKMLVEADQLLRFENEGSGNVVKLSPLQLVDGGRGLVAFGQGLRGVVEALRCGMRGLGFCDISRAACCDM